MLFFLALFMLLYAISATAMQTGKLTIKAVNEHMQVIEGAKVTIGFTKPNPSGIGLSETQLHGVTDKNGEFSASSPTMYLVGFSVEKDGYYQSGAGYEFKSRSKLLNRWEPWDPIIEIILKKKLNPVPMFAETTGWIKVPVLDVPVGYDLEKGDWVAPYGKGIINDFIFKFSSEVKQYNEYEVGFALTFSNELDGIQEYIFDSKDQSNYKWPYEAPGNGFSQGLEKEIVKVPEKLTTNRKENVNYIFRVRTKTDNDGNITSARYGKLFGEFGIGKDGEIRFDYYFNPDGTRNLEFDPKKNLFQWQNWREQQKHALTRP